MKTTAFKRLLKVFEATVRNQPNAADSRDQSNRDREYERSRRKLIQAYKEGGDRYHKHHYSRMILPCELRLPGITFKPGSPMGNVISALRSVNESAEPISTFQIQDTVSFESWAEGKGYNLELHPLMDDYLDKRTRDAHAGWSAALKYMESKS